MSSISSLASYYQLANLQSGTAASTTGTASLVQSLADALQSSSTDTSSGDDSSSDAYLLNLSSSAQQYLSGNSSGTTSDSSSTEFTLTAAQQKTITQILDKYKDAPATQATFDAIQNDLEAAGLGPDKLSAQDQITSFNPTDALIQALNGNYSSPTAPETTQSDEQTKATNYMQAILADWQSISAAAGNTTTSASTSTSSENSAS